MIRFLLMFQFHGILYHEGEINWLAQVSDVWVLYHDGFGVSPVKNVSS